MGSERGRPFTPAARLFLDRGWRFLAAKVEQRVDTQPPHQDFKQWFASLRPRALDGIRDDGNDSAGLTVRAIVRRDP